MYYFCNFTVTSVTIGLKYLIYNVLSGDRRGDRRVIEVTVKAENQQKNAVKMIENKTKMVENEAKIIKK